MDTLIIIIYSLGCFALGYVTRAYAEKKSREQTYKEGRKDGYEQATGRIKAYTQGQKEIIRMLEETRGLYNGKKNEL